MRTQRLPGVLCYVRFIGFGFHYWFQQLRGSSFWRFCLLGVHLLKQEILVTHHCQIHYIWTNPTQQPKQIQSLEIYPFVVMFWCLSSLNVLRIAILCICLCVFSCLPWFADILSTFKGITIVSARFLIVPTYQALWLARKFHLMSSWIYNP